MQNRLKIEFRQKQLYYNQDVTQPITVDCDVNGAAIYNNPGLVPKPDWEDMTDYTEGLEKIKFSWSATGDDYTEGNNSSGANQFGSNYQKGLTAELRFTGPAYEYIFDWLMTTQCQLLNAIEAKITDLECGKEFRLFELKLDNTRLSSLEPCIVSMPLREMDTVWHSFQKTIIEDDWQKWFNSDGTSVKDHPTFGMIVEKKPKFFLSIYIALVYVVGMLSTGILVALNEGKRWIKKTLGFTYLAPGPLIRTYIENICSKYGYTFDTIFDDDPANPYRDACLVWPASASYKNFDDFISPSTKFIWDNRSVLPFSKFLDQLKELFNAEWYITPNSKLVFKHKSFFDNQPPLYDFTAPGAMPFYELEYNFDGKKKPAYGNYQYLIDPQDSCSNEVKWRYNSIVDFDGPANNPMLEGNVTKSFAFAATAFHKDGSSVDFLEDGVETGRLIAAGAVLLGLIELFTSSNFLTVVVVAALLTVGYVVTNDYVNNFFDSVDLNGMMRVSNSELNVPRILLWDRNTAMNEAKVVSVEDPAINPYYNTNNVDYYNEHPAQDAPGYFGGTVRKIYNYPFFVDEKFLGNMYDRFHEYDNPIHNPTINQMWKMTLDLCCEWLDILGAWSDTFMKIGGVMILEDRKGRKIKGRLESVEITYDKGIITLSGKVLK